MAKAQKNKERMLLYFFKKAGDEGIEPPIAVLETAVIPFN